MQEGTYPAIVRKTDLSTTQNGHLRIGVKLLVNGEEEMWGNVYFSEKAMHIARKSLKAMGFDPDTRSIVEMEDNPELLAGNECEVTVKPDTYKADGSTKIAFINPKKIRPTPEKLAEMDAALRAIKSEDEAKEAEAKDMERQMGDIMNPKPGDPDYKPTEGGA